MEWISVKDRLPPRPDKTVKFYLVVVQRESRTLHRIAKWTVRPEKKDHHQSRRQLLKESNKCIWIVCNFKGKEVTHWMPLPKLPEINIDKENI